jgi:hypothetical protein
MKKVIYTLIIQSVLLLHNYSYGQSASLNSVTIKWVDFNIETIADVSCDAFDNSFNEGKKKVKFIFNKTDLLQFQALLNEFKPVKNMRSFDTRGSVNFIYGKNGKYYFNKKLMIFISDKIFTRHPKYLDTLRQYE